MAFSTAAAVNPSTSLTDDQLASRFLAQATFGPTTESIAELRALGLDYRRWIDEQANLPASSAVALIDAALSAGQITTVDRNTNRRARNEVMLAGRDQLRQRVAYALSQIMVVSDYESAVANAREGSSSYYDMLARNALGSFRTLMLDVTRHPMMGRYLTYYKNPKGNAAAGTQPDENYAREVMQLCTVGLYQLAADGTILTDPTGRAIETYSNTNITEFARVFTGFTDANSNPNPVGTGAGRTNFPAAAQDYTRPMMMWDPQHDQGSKRLLSYPGARKPVLPANQGGLRDVEDAIDNLIEHPSTAPFISRQLIQRLVSSNPSPGYIARVAAVFVDNGAGVRGDLLAVVRAILLDEEARSTASIGRTESGKLKEPFLRVTGLLRACRYQAPAGALTHDLGSVVTEATLGQFPLSSPSVFNFYSPEHRPPGPLADAGLVGPEFQILTSVFAVTFPNAVYTLTQTGAGRLTLDLSAQEGLAENPAALVENLNVLLAHGTLSETAKARLVAAINGVSSAMVPAGSTLRQTRARLAVYLVAIAPETAVSK
ncbi:MAG: hypothetical protein RIS54_1159 [Verrucomicrobiota bacterium]|jgi:uncharacterized protein (DUF1800 family)